MLRVKIERREGLAGMLSQKAILNMAFTPHLTTWSRWAHIAIFGVSVGLSAKDRRCRHLTVDIPHFGSQPHPPNHQERRVGGGGGGIEPAIYSDYIAMKQSMGDHLHYQRRGLDVFRYFPAGIQLVMIISQTASITSPLGTV